VIRLWDLKSGRSNVLPLAHEEKLNSASFSPDGRLLATAGGAWLNDKNQWDHRGEVCLWDVASRKLLVRFEAHCGSVTCAVFSPDGKSLATTGRDGKMYLWDVTELIDLE
jgi:WD40 repeat protein